MSISSQPSPSPESASRWQWRVLAEQILDGHALTEHEGLAILGAADVELLEILDAAYLIRRQYFGNTVQVYSLTNAKSGLCPEDCGYCSQSKVATSEIPQYRLLGREELLEGARQAVQRQAKTYCMVISAREPSEREMQAVEAIVPEIKQRHHLKICTSLGLLTAEQARRLKACGVDRVNHNLNTSSDYYRRVCSTHSYKDRLETLRNVREAGLEMCSGGIVGMGEEDIDVVRMAIELRELKVHSIPVNFHIPIEGTPLAAPSRLNPRYCLKALAMFRYANPDRELRIAGGRELHLGSMQCLGLYAANSLFAGDYLTTPGQAPDADRQMIEEMGFTVTSK
jgi:biotin synthase